MSEDPANPDVTNRVFPYFSVGFICFIINLTAIGYFQSVENVKAATVFALLRGGIFLVPSFMIMPELSGIPGIWLAMPVSEILTTLSIGGYYITQRTNSASTTMILVKS